MLMFRKGSAQVQVFLLFRQDWCQLIDVGEMKTFVCWARPEPRIDLECKRGRRLPSRSYVSPLSQWKWHLSARWWYREHKCTDTDVFSVTKTGLSSFCVPFKFLHSHLNVISLTVIVGCVHKVFRWCNNSTRNSTSYRPMVTRAQGKMLSRNANARPRVLNNLCG